VESKVDLLEEGQGHTFGRLGDQARVVSFFKTPPLDLVSRSLRFSVIAPLS